MAFGPIMRLHVPQKDKTPALAIELAPLTKEAMGDFASKGGLQSYPVMRFLVKRTAVVVEDELEWFDKARQDKDSIIWGIWTYENATRKLIGTIGLNSIEYGPSGLRQAVNGVLIFKPYWNKGIARYVHHATTWYAFTELGIARIKSAVIQGNEASRKAHDRSGYTLVYVERNTCFTDGALRHQDNLECLNPLEPFWSSWWGADKPSKASVEARQVTSDVLDWAKTNITLP